MLFCMVHRTVVIVVIKALAVCFTSQWEHILGPKKNCPMRGLEIEGQNL